MVETPAAFQQACCRQTRTACGAENDLQRRQAGEHGKRTDLIDFTPVCGEYVGRNELNTFMNSNEPKILTRDMKAAVVPISTKVTLQKGEAAYITQSFGGSCTVVMNGNMFCIEDKNADASGPEDMQKSIGATSGMADTVHDSVIARHTADTNRRTFTRTTRNNSRNGPRPAMSEFLAQETRLS
jgi:hypothetical protein